MTLPEQPPAGDPLPRHASSFGVRYAWRSVPGGVLATEDKGQSWHPIFPLPADRILRASRLNGLITVGGAPGKCACQPRIPLDGGRRRALAPDERCRRHLRRPPCRPLLVARRSVFQVTPWPATQGPLRRRASSTRRRNRSLPGACETESFTGPSPRPAPRRRGWDIAPTFILLKDGEAASMKLPEVTGLVLVQSVSVDGKTLDVVGHDYGFAGADAPTVDWHSEDGGGTWAVTRTP